MNATLTQNDTNVEQVNGDGMTFEQYAQMWSDAERRFKITANRSVTAFNLLPLED